MPVHDWTRIGAGVFHSFHLSWTDEIMAAHGPRFPSAGAACRRTRRPDAEPVRLAFGGRDAGS